MRSDNELNKLALKLRKELGEELYTPIDIFSLINGWSEKNITITKYPMSCNTSGMCFKNYDDTVIAINSNMSYGRQRFTLAHELYHALFEDENKTIICDMNIYNEKSDSEKEADLFASYLLMPKDAMLNYNFAEENLELSDIIKLEQFFQISHQAMLYKLLKENYINLNQYEQFKNIKISLEAAKLGYDTDLYFPSQNNKQYFTTGSYIRKVEKLIEKDNVSDGKIEELLLDAYRADIVYGFDEEEYFLND